MDLTEQGIDSLRRLYMDQAQAMDICAMSTIIALNLTRP